MNTKGQLVAEIFRRLEQYLIDEKIINRTDLQTVIETNNVTLNRKVAAVENFLFGPYDAGQLLPFLRSELAKGRLLLIKIKPELGRIAKTPISDMQLQNVHNALVRIIKILRK